MSFEIKDKIQQAIKGFSKGSLFNNTIQLFSTLGYRTERQSRLSKNNYTGFIDDFPVAKSRMNEKKTLQDDWQSIELVFQLTQAEMSRQSFLFDSGKVDNTIIEAYLFFAIELSGKEYSRTQLSIITRELNKVFSMPVMVLFKYDNNLTLSVIKRRLHKLDGSKDVLEKVALIKDVSIDNPHRAHIEILYDLSFDKLQSDFEFRNFVELHNAWQKTLDSSELNKRFYKELANWYFWAIEVVEFPDDAEKDREKRNSVNVIRMLTRLIFVWFLKEKDNLIPDELFNKKKLDKILDYKDKTGSTYYKAILQNLFFATLNTEMNNDVPGNRTFVKRQYGIQEFYRYERFFKDKDNALKLFENIPFLNGGLFENLDKNIGEPNEQRIDCFSNKRDNEERLSVPDYLFFATEKQYDKLNKVYDTINKKYIVRGLLEILNKYKFTIHENTPIEEEIALDPELLGKVFENLLASYNEETKTTARKLTGSFYTPREVVNYMVEESLIAYFKNILTEFGSEGGEEKLRDLFSYNENEPQFSEKEKTILIEAIDNCKIVDPACGSGAFPMGILHKMVFILSKLDPHNERWMQRQIDKVYDIPDTTLHDNLKAEIEKAFNENFNDYGRKLYLVENCIYGIDIQPIAVQIAKLRFFISLIVDQKVNRNTKNLGIRPLPNLETKFVAGNTLIGIERPNQLSLRNEQIDVKEKQLRDVRERHFNARTPATKKRYRERDKELRKELADLLESDGFKPETTQLMASWDPYNQNNFAGFFDSEWMFGLQNGFDVVIGNPPFVRVQNLSKEEKTYYNEHFHSATGNYDLYVLFIEKGFLLLREKGISCFIHPNKFFVSNYGIGLRSYLSAIKAPCKILDFRANQVFETATTYTCISFLTKKVNSQVDYFAFKENISFNDVIAFFASNNWKQFNSISANTITVEPWLFSDAIEISILTKILISGNKLESISIYISQGLKTGADKIFISDEFSSLEKEILIKVLKGEEIQRYMIEYENKKAIFPYSKIDNETVPKTEKEFKKSENAFNYLFKYKPQLLARDNGRIKNAEWFLFSRNQFINLIGRQKIITRDISQKPAFAIDLKGEYGLMGGYGIILKPQYNYKYVLAILNSNVSYYHISKISVLFRGNYYSYESRFIKQLIIPEVAEEVQEIFSIVIDYILQSISKESNKANYYEKVIDAMVYELFFPMSIKASNAQVIELVRKQIPDISGIIDEQEKMNMIERVYKKLNESNNEIRNCIIKQNIGVEEVKLINQSLSKHAPSQDNDTEF